MGEHIFNFEVNGDALRYLQKAMDKYIEKWPGGSAEEQEKLKEIKLGLDKAMLDYQMIMSE